eukprot:365042-Chlamydomonas_euryale.AAC.28
MLEFKQQMTDVDRQHIQDREKWKRETATKIKETKIAMMKLTDNQLEMTTKRTIMENEQMSLELAYQSRQTEKDRALAWVLVGLLGSDCGKDERLSPDWLHRSVQGGKVVRWAGVKMRPGGGEWSLSGSSLHCSALRRLRSVQQCHTAGPHGGSACVQLPHPQQLLQPAGYLKALEAAHPSPSAESPSPAPACPCPSVLLAATALRPTRLSSHHRNHPPHTLYPLHAP